MYFKLFSTSIESCITSFAAFRYDFAFKISPVWAANTERLFRAAPLRASDVRHSCRQRFAKLKSPVV